MIERAAAIEPIPVIKPNEAMFRAALAHGNRIVMIATSAVAVPTLREEFEEEARRMNSSARLSMIVVPEAMRALQAGDVGEHNSLISARAREAGDCDALVLAQFSMARAAETVRQTLKCPVLTSPESAVRWLRHLVETGRGRGEEEQRVIFSPQR